MNDGLQRILYDCGQFKGSGLVVAAWLAYCALPWILWFVFGMRALAMVNNWFVTIHGEKSLRRDTDTQA